MENKPEIRVLFISRGRGHGHAIPDMAMVTELNRVAPHIKIRFASYATGAETLRESGHEIVDLNLCETPGFVDSFLSCYAAIKRELPDIIVSHEEFSALTAGEALGIPSIFISAWLPQINTIGAEALRNAGAIVIIENPGIFPILPGLRGRLHYVGPIFRALKFNVTDREQLRSEMGYSQEMAIVLVVPGGWATEERAPLFDLVLSAFLSLPLEDKQLIWVSSADLDLLRSRASGIKGITILPFYKPIERLLALADVVVTKGTRGITMDAVAVGVPSISLSDGQNPVDDILVSRIHSNIALNSRAVTSNVLASYIQHAIDGGISEPLTGSAVGVELPAQTVLREIEALSRKGPTLQVPA